MTLAWDPSREILTYHESQSTTNLANARGASRASHLPVQDHCQSKDASRSSASPWLVPHFLLSLLGYAATKAAHGAGAAEKNVSERLFM